MLLFCTCVLSMQMSVFRFFKDQSGSIVYPSLGATILSWLVSSIRKNPNLNYPTYCWTHSLTVLCWVMRNNKLWKQYVKNRVEEIQTLMLSAGDTVLVVRTQLTFPLDSTKAGN